MAQGRDADHPFARQPGEGTAYDNQGNIGTPGTCPAAESSNALALRTFLVASASVLELAFARDAFKRLARIFDAVLVIGAVRRQQPHDFVGAVRDHVADRAGGEVDGLTDPKLVLFQRSSPGQQALATLVASAVPRSGVQYSSQFADCLKNSAFSPARVPTMGLRQNSKQSQLFMEKCLPEIAASLVGNMKGMPAAKAKQGTRRNQAAMFSTRQK
jgi:hypothetical protein